MLCRQHSDTLHIKESKTQNTMVQDTMTPVNDLVYKKKYTKIKKIVIKKLSKKRKKIFSSSFLNFLAPLIVADVACCLRKQGLMAFCEKSCLEMDTSSSPVCVKKRVMCGGREFKQVKFMKENNLIFTSFSKLNNLSSLSILCVFLPHYLIENLYFSMRLFRCIISMLLRLFSLKDEVKMRLFY